MSIDTHGLPGWQIAAIIDVVTEARKPIQHDTQNAIDRAVQRAIDQIIKTKKDTVAK